MPWLGTFYGSPVAVPCRSAFCLLEELQVAPRQRSFQATDVGVPFGLHRVHRVNELERDTGVGFGPILTGSYRRWERIVVFLCLLDFAWFWIAFRLGPPVGQIVKHALAPSMPAGGITPELMFLVIAIVGTTIAPWQLFFQQSCIADKRLRFADVKWAR